MADSVLYDVDVGGWGKAAPGVGVAGEPETLVLPVALESESDRAQDKPGFLGRLIKSLRFLTAIGRRPRGTVPRSTRDDGNGGRRVVPIAPVPIDPAVSSKNAVPRPETAPDPTPASSVAADLRPLRSHRSNALDTSAAATAADARRDGASLRGGWRAWRERGAYSLTSTVWVSGSCSLPEGVASAGSKVVLMEVSPSTLATASVLSSSILVLERVVVPPPLGGVGKSNEGTGAIVAAANRSWGTVPVSFRKTERGRSAGEPSAQSISGDGVFHPRYTHVTILPEGITIPIQDA